MEEAETGRFIDMLQGVAPFPERPVASKRCALTELSPQEAVFRHHPAYPLF